MVQGVCEDRRNEKPDRVVDPEINHPSRVEHLADILYYSTKETVVESYLNPSKQGHIDHVGVISSH